MLKYLRAYCHKLFKPTPFFGLIILACLNVSAQDKLSNTIISISIENQSLNELLNQIAEKGDLSFSFNPNKINLEQKLTYQASKPINEILDDIMKLSGLEYRYIEKQIILKPSKSSIKQGRNKATLHGYIKNNSNGEALIGATVFIEQLGTGTVSNSYGFYSITVSKGTYTVSYSFVGFEELSHQIDINNNSNNTVVLIEKPPILQDVLVTATSPQMVEEIQMSKTNIQPKTVSEMPALFGEMDVVKSLEFVPGIKSHSDGSTFYYVRGGHRDQNLIMIDDAPIFNSSHMLGIFSTIIPDAINDITIYKGNMPASLGGRLSSVIDIRTKKGNDKKFQAWGNLGLISSKLGLEGPIVKEKSSFLVSGRLSRIKWFFKQESDDLKDLYFYDLTGKLNFDVSSSDKLFISMYSGSDNYFESNSGIKWANAAGTLRWNHIFNNRLFLNTTIAGSTYDYYLHTDIVNNTKWKSHIANINVKGDFSYFITPQNVLSFGLAINGHNFNPGNLTTDDPDVQPPLVSIKNAAEGILYVGHEVRFKNNLGVNYGLRLSSWANQGASFEFLFDDDHNVVDTLFFEPEESYNQYDNIEPRLGISYFLTDHSSLKASYSRNVQNVHLISNSISPFTSLEVWLPSSFNIKPELADQVALGYSHFLPKVGISLSLEGYYKEMQNQIDYEPHAQTLLNPLMESELRFGSTKAYGTELLIKKDEGRIRGWLGYTYSRTKRKTPEINNGQAYNAFHDRPHELDMVINYDLTLKIKLGMNWVYYSGSPYSSPISFFDYNGLETPIYGQRNNSRLPDYHRMDLSATFRLNKNKNERFEHDLTFSFYNVYGRKNTLFINYNKKETQEGDFKIPSNLLENSRITSQYYLFRFTPSLTYNFRFL